MFSAQGYTHLGWSLEGHDPRFQAGMRASAKRLSDAPSDWEAPYAEGFHALLLVAHEDPDTLRAEVRHLTASLNGAGVVTAVERGHRLRDRDGQGVEPFGFADGISNPRFFHKDIQSLPDGTSLFDPSAEPRVALVRDPGTDHGESYGSYAVFRKLEQDVRGFRRREAELAVAMGASGEDERARVAACIIGRFRDGTPLAIHGRPGGAQPAANNFDYAHDPAGSRCPFHAHIRKMTPRGEHMPMFDERRVRIVRRGLPYGIRKASWDPTALPAASLPEKGVGLLFLCYQAEIGTQFETLQEQYANDETFLYGMSPGLDPLIGQGRRDADGKAIAPTGTQRWPRAWNHSDAGSVDFDFHGFVRVLGGEYLFAPSIAFLAGTRTRGGDRGGDLEQFGSGVRELLVGLLTNPNGGPFR